MRKITLIAAVVAIIALLGIMVLAIDNPVAPGLEKTPGPSPGGGTAPGMVSSSSQFVYNGVTYSSHDRALAAMVAERAKNPASSAEIVSVNAQGQPYAKYDYTDDEIAMLTGESPAGVGVDVPASPDGKTAGNDGAAFKNPERAADSNRIANGAAKISEFLKQEYPGIAGLGGMLVGAVPALADWKAAVDEAFCDTIILGGKTCWVQKICESSSDYPGGDGILVDSKWGNNTLEITFYAHVEGQRSQPVISVNPDGTTKTEYLYKITYSIRNPQKKENNAYQLRFFYPGGSYDWFPNWQPLPKGTTISATGGSAIVSYSTRMYTRVCLVFQKSVEVNGQSTMQVCNTIVQYGGGATPIAGAPAAAGSSATSELGAEKGTPAEAGKGF